ncbi:MAG: leucyl aminopeptidase [Rhodoferax sp.]
MDFELQTLNFDALARSKADALVVWVPPLWQPQPGAPLIEHLCSVRNAGDLPDEAGRLLSLYRPAALQCTHLVLVSLGSGSVADMRKAVVAAAGALKAAKPRHIELVWLADPKPAALYAAITGLADATYVYTTTLTRPQPRSLERVTLRVSDPAALQACLAQSVAAVRGIEVAKEWANRPANHATPNHLAKAARELAKRPRVQCEILGPDELRKLGMGAFLAVAQGSEEPPRFIVLHYKGARKSVAPTVLVGKGITFDSGGISLKPAPEMDEMKFDMCGAASVLGVFHALAELQPKINVVGLVAACENLPSGRALKPGDVITSMSGQTIEVLNTDAEGRLILCDALSYAERFSPRAVIDIATLTGACVIALGAVRSGCFASDGQLSAALVNAGEAAQDLCWPMPLDDDYAEGLKTNFADVANTGGRPAGAITAAKFLQRFAGKYPWAHLDIAGTAWKSGNAKGATGRPVGLLLSYLLAQAA